MPGADAACPPVRIGYIDQDRPPYWLGSGAEVPDPAGVGVDYLRAMAAAIIACPIQFIRMPTTRKLKRVDGVALTVGQLNDMDQSIAERHGNEIVRLRVPLFSSNIWLATNPAYYAAHREQVEAAWTWMSTHQNELGSMLTKYSRK